MIKLSILHTVEIARFFRRKKAGSKQTIFLFLATERLCSLLITGRRYSLLVIEISSRSQISRQIYSRYLANVNSKYASEKIYPGWLKQ